ncbi:hypothetical protein [Parabacteroides johnsonii]|uniref:hypothetical protein n=1 Tax=Parabacteroides johnsonii TaxID=387661 RepID=UPI001898AA7C|nr:hypothetical protein [Parabacteroides johnsonii]
MNTLNLQGEQLELFNQIASLDNESFAKVKRYVKRVIHDHQRGKAEKKIGTISDEEIEDAMRPYSYEEKLERLKVSETDPVVYMHEDVKKMSLEWLK